VTLFKVFDTPTTFVSFGGTKGSKGDSAYTPVTISTAQTIALADTDIGKTYICTHTSGAVVFEVESTVSNGFEITVIRQGGAVTRVISNSLTVNGVVNGDFTILTNYAGVFVQKHDGIVTIIGSRRET